MPLTKLLVFSLLAATVWSEPRLKFPPGFKFGAATSAYQIEGAWNVSDKGESIWDRFTHSHPERMYNGNTGDVACDSYYRWNEDVHIAAELGLHHYRFSISWSRLLPNGTTNYISKSGIKYYNDLIDELLKNGIAPMITLYHWDLPQRLQEFGGWTNPLITDWFADYARVVFNLYADRVKYWITINEPLIMCDHTFNSGMMAPGILDPHIGSYLCTKFTLVAHAKAWRIYDEEFKPKFHGMVSFTNQLVGSIVQTTPGNEELVELYNQLANGIYSHPIYSKDGGWPPTVEKLFAEISKKQGYPRSRLPPFTKEEIDLIRGTYDYYGINYYTSRVLRTARDGEVPGPWPCYGSIDFGIVAEVLPEWERSAAEMFVAYPPGLRRIIKWLKRDYGDLKFFITENGLPTEGTNKLDDVDRAQFIHDHLKQILFSIHEDGANVIGYTVWSLMDNLEWNEGYKFKFGLYEVDFENPKRPRIPRKSADYYRRIIKKNALIPYKRTKEEL